MRRLTVLLFCLALGVACVSVQRPADDDFSRLKTFEAFRLKLRLPAAFVRFEEPPSVSFRPDPPSRTSPGVQVLQYTDRSVTRVLEESYAKVRDRMSGEPLPVRGVVGGREVMGVYSELVTHLIWIYVFEAGGAVYLVHIAAPVTWTDEKILEFHDLVCRNVTLPAE